MIIKGIPPEHLGCDEITGLALKGFGRPVKVPGLIGEVDRLQI